MRGIGQDHKKRYIREMIIDHKLDFVGISETIKQDFGHHELLAIDPLEQFSWKHLAALRHSGGMLLGFDQAIFEVLAWDAGTFFLAGHIRHRQSQRELVVIQVYGPADHARSAEFLSELQAKVHAISSASIPFVVGGILT